MSHSALVLGIGKRNATVRLISAVATDLGLSVVGCDASPTVPARAAVDRFELVPSANDPSFGDRVEQLVALHSAKVLITLIDPEIVPLGRRAALLPNSAVVCHPDADTAALCEDKLAFYEHLVAHGLPAIPTSLTPPHGVPRFVSKDRFGSGGSGFAVHSSVDQGLALDPPGTIFQPYHGGQHFCVDAYYSLNGGALVDLCAKAVLAKTRGESFVLESVPPNRFVELLDRLGVILGLHGIVNMDLYEEPDGNLSIMEINCRIGGNYPASHRLGVDLLTRLFREVLAGELPKVHDQSAYVAGLTVGKFYDFSDPIRLE